MASNAQGVWSNSEAALLLDIATLAPPVVAGCVKVSVQVVEAFGPRLAGLHANEETSTGATSATVELAELLL